jgi:hypothetical protein
MSHVVRQGGCVTDLDPQLAAARPELVVTTLLQQALWAGRHTLAVAHPELRDEEGVLDDPDDVTYLAFLIAIFVSDLDALLQQYRDAVEAQWRSDDGELPF